MARLFSATAFVVFRRTLDPENYKRDTYDDCGQDDVDECLRRDREGVNTLWSSVACKNNTLVRLEPYFALPAEDALEYALVLFTHRLIHFASRVPSEVQGSGASLGSKVAALALADLNDAFSTKQHKVKLLMDGLAEHAHRSDDFIPVMCSSRVPIDDHKPATKFLWL